MVLSRRAARCRLVGPTVLAVVAIFASPAPAGATPYTVATEQLVVQLGQSASRDPALLFGGLPGAVPQLLPGQRWSTDLPDAEAVYAESELSGRPGVNYVSPIENVRAADLVPNNPCYNQTCGPTKPVTVENPFAGSGATIVHPNGQTDLWAVHAATAWNITTGSPSDLVAVLDTGVDPNQPQLKGKVIIGPDVCADDRPQCSSPYDKNGHGTFVTGIIAASTNDGIGIAGLGWNTKVIDIKVLDDTGSGNSMDEATGIYDAVSAGAKVINLSLESEPCSQDPDDCGPNTDEESAVEYAIAHGVVVVAAAGNYDSQDPIYPADYPGVLSVAASTDQGSVDPANGPTSIFPSTAMRPISPPPESTCCPPGTTGTTPRRAALPWPLPMWQPRPRSLWRQTPPCRALKWPRCCGKRRRHWHQGALPSTGACWMWAPP